MERIRNLDRYQKGVLIISIVMVLVFAVIYATTAGKVGYVYADAFLRISEENGDTVYSGRMNGTQLSFTVTPDKTVTFRYGDTVYGPYTAKLDPTATPEGHEHMTGVELRRGDEVIFRGGALQTDTGVWLENENPYLPNTSPDSPEPSYHVILNLMGNPELTQRGNWIFFIMGALVCLINVPLILFADEIFRYHMFFRVNNVDEVEPSDWEIISRYISWTIMPIMAFVVFLLGFRII